MKYDPQVPLKLKEVQQWFASIIVRPIDSDSHMMPTSPSGIPMEAESPHFIRPSPTLQPHQRIELYNQQYWWRLLTILQENTPFLVRLFGYKDFNELIAEPYLQKYPPRHWSLSLLSDRLVYWIEEEYMGDNRELVRDAATLDWAYLASFFAPEHPAPSDESSVLYLQPSVQLLSFPFDLVAFRTEMMQHSPDHWVDHDFPEITNRDPHYFVISRNSLYNILVDRVTALDFEVLKLFQSGISIDALCDWIEAQEPSKAAQAEANLQNWFQMWTSRSWLTPKK